MSQPHPPSSPASGREEEEESSDEEQPPELMSRHDKLAELFKWPSGLPVRFFLHDSLTAGMKAEAKKKIEAHGGQTTVLERKARVVLVSEARLTMPFNIFRLRYDRNPDPVLRDIYAEPITFLNRCANMGSFNLGEEKRIKMGMPGPRPRADGYGYRGRVEFTNEDDHHLCRYLAIAVPNKKDGGRMGNQIYKELEDLGRNFLDSHGWAKRHTWQSWRNRYSKNQGILDEIISLYAAHPRKDGKGEYERARKHPHGVHASDSESPEPEEDADNEDLQESSRARDHEEEHEQEDDVSPVVKKRGHAGGAGAVKDRKKKRIAALPEVEAARGALGNDKAKPRRKDKGKQREERYDSPDPFQDIDMVGFDFGNDDINMHYDEPGPSNTQRSPSLVLPPSPTLVSQNQARQLNVRSAPTQAVMSSQATVVPTQHQSKTRPTQTHANPTQNMSTTSAVAKKQPVPSQGGVGRKTARKAIPNPAAPPAPAPVPARVEQPPFRITRARSRSVESGAAAKARDKGKGKGKKTTTLQAVAEDRSGGRDADTPPLSLSQTGPEPMAETYEEEEVVDQLLSEAPMGPEDDAQIRRALENPAQTRGMVMATDDEDSDEEDDELDKLIKAREAQFKQKSRSKPSVPSTSRSQTNANPMTGRTVHNPLVNISTPVPGPRLRSTRAPAVSVQEATFPSPGTRARVVRDQKEQESRRAPYEPPEGTRASVHKARLRP